MNKEQMELLLHDLADWAGTLKECIADKIEECGCDDRFLVTDLDSEERARAKRAAQWMVKRVEAYEAALTQHGLTGMIYVEG